MNSQGCQCCLQGGAMKVTSFQFVSVDILAQGWFALHSARVGRCGADRFRSWVGKISHPVDTRRAGTSNQKRFFFRHRVQFRANHTGCAL